MSGPQVIRVCAGVSALAVCLAPASGWACSVCFGQSEGPIARGMNWGIISLLFVVVCVLGAIGAFFIYLAKRSAAIELNAVHGRAGGASKNETLSHA